MISVLLAEDHETVREGLRHLVNAQNDMHVVGEADNGKSVVQQASALDPNVVVLDLSMPEMDGIAAARSLRASSPSAAVVALTRHRDDAYVQQLFSAGALAYVLKQSPSIELLKAIRSAATGTPYLDPALQSREPRREPAQVHGITARETSVLRMAAVGHSNKQIASALGISVKTVEVHKSNAMQKLRLASRTDIVKYAALQGWLDDL